MPSLELNSSPYQRLPGVNAGTAEFVGGGGGGGDRAAFGGGGGGSGGWASKAFTGMTAASYAYTIGTGGVGAVGGSADDGANGTDSGWGDLSALKATGGLGGEYNTGTGGAGGSGNVGDSTANGDNGDNGELLGVGGNGGTSALTPYGDGGKGGSNDPEDDAIAGADGIGAFTYTNPTLEITAGPVSDDSGDVLASMTVRVKCADTTVDNNANTAGGALGIEVTLIAGPGTITAGTTTRAYGGSGTCTFNDIVITGSTASSYQLRFTDLATGVSVDSSTFTITGDSAPKTGMMMGAV